MINKKIKFLVFPEKIQKKNKEEEIWVAQCLEHDMCIQSSNIDNLKKAIKRMIYAYYHLAPQRGLDSFLNFPQAPQKYWDKFRSGTIKIDSLNIKSICIEIDFAELYQVEFDGEEK